MALLTGCQSQRPVSASVVCDRLCQLEAPRIVFVSTEHNFGRVAMGSRNTCSFEFLNDGGKALIVEGIHASCGCTVTQAEATTIAPGQASEIAVTYHAGTFGKSRKRILVATNDPQNPQTELWVVAEVPGSPKPAQTPQPGSISSPRANQPSQGTMSPELRQALRNLNKATGG